MKTNKLSNGLFTAGLLALILAVLFWRSFLPGYVHFSNDGPLGQQNSAWLSMPQGLTGVWCDLAYLGGNGGVFAPSISGLLHVVLSPVMFTKFNPVVALFILGLGAWSFFRQLQLSPLAATLGALATLLNSTFFSCACWGVAGQQIALGLDFFALALIVGSTPETPRLARWARLALAGLCVGMNVMEASDIGALYSLVVAAFVFFHALASREGLVLQKVARGVIRTAVVALFAGFIAWQTVQSLVGTAITGIAGAGQEAETKAAHWDWATQWSLPKVETLGLAVPGLFGYKMDTPKNMIPATQDFYRNGAYWGGMGRDPSIDRYFDAGSHGPQPPGYMRFTGGGNYAGILVLLVAGWAIAQTFRRQNSLFPRAQKRMIWFWAAVVVLGLLLSWGRFAPFYAWFYQLPYVSTIRNPAKFLNFFSLALVIIFAYGIHALNRRYLDAATRNAASLTTHCKNWWAKVNGFDRQWAYASFGLFGASALGWLIYAAQKPALIRFLQKVGYPDADPTHEYSAPAIAAFSLGQAGWAVALFTIALGLLLLVITGYFGGSRARLGGALLGGLLILDMARANLPWVIHWDYQQKYEVGSLNPILEFLRDKSYEHRVAGLPFETQQSLRGYDNAFGGNGIYRIEWMQHHFPYYNIQTLDIWQMPRMPEDIKAFKEALAPRGDLATAPLITREWLLTNTRYLLGAAGYLDVMNQQLDPAQHRFRIAQRFDILAKPGITQPTQLEDLTAAPSDDGDLALFEFTGALPRAKVYASWQVNTNDPANLKKLGDLSFDPAQTVLISTPQNNLPPAATNANSGTVAFQGYATKHIILAVTNPTPAVLLLNDKFDPQWRVSVDGQPAGLLRCNFMMRGVYLPTPGAHTVEFDFTLPHRQLYLTLSAIGLGILLCAFLALNAGKRQTIAP